MKRLAWIALSSGALIALGALACTEGPTLETARFVTRGFVPDAEWIDDAAATPADAAGDVSDAGAPDACPATNADYPPGTWMPRKPPRDGTFACEAGQTSTLVSACEFDESPCSGLPGSFVPCVFCLYTRDTDATYGFRTYVPKAHVERLNYRGYALRAGASEACAGAIEDYAACLDVACSCARADRKPTCFKRAKGAACANASDAITPACGAHPAASFLRPIIEANQFSTKEQALTMAKALCGGT